MSKYEELSKLKELLDAGVLSKEEFETEKKKILEAPEEIQYSSTPTKNPGFFSKEAARQRQEAFEKLPKAEQQRQQMMVVGIGIFFAIFACMLMFFVMLFGWSGVKAGIENLWGR